MNLQLVYRCVQLPKLFCARICPAFVFASGLLISMNCYAGGAAGDALLGAIAGGLEAAKQQAEAERQEEAQRRLADYRFELEKKRIDEQHRRNMLLLEQERAKKAREQQAQLEEDEQRKKKAEEDRRLSLSTGTGFFVNPNGYLITNNHVVEEKKFFAIRDYKGHFYRANVVAKDYKRDLAMLKVSGDFPSLKLARSESVEKGSRVFAVGYPQVKIQGNESKVTDGVISSFSGIGDEQDWFQISTPIQGGNSGGPLIREDGAVIGVVVATANAAKFFNVTGGSLPQNVNYAIKSNVVIDFLSERGVANISRNAKKRVSILAVDQATVLVLANGSPFGDEYFPSTVTLESKSQQASDEDQRSAKVSRIFPDWKDVKEDQVFKAWVQAQEPGVRKMIESSSATDIANVLRRFNAEKKGFSDGYFQALGLWVADENGCRFLTEKQGNNDRAVWIGRCKDGRGYGQGELVLISDGTPREKFIGDFKYGMLNGPGRKELLGSPAFLEGMFINGKLNGKGKGKDKNGHVYEGGYKDGEWSGDGKLTSSNGEVIEGVFVEGKPHGLASIKKNDGSSYVGNFTQGKPDGRGKKIDKSGNVYDGEFREGKEHGSGIITFSNGRTISVKMVDGKIVHRENVN